MTEGFTSCATLIASVEQLRSRRLHQRSSRRHSRGVHRHHWRSQDGRQGRHPSSSRQLHLHLPPPHSYGPRSHGNDPSLRHRPSRRSRGSVSERSAEGGSKLSLGRRAPQGGTHEARRTGDEEGCQMGEGGERRRNFTFTASLLTPFRRWFDERPSRATSTSSPRLLPHRPSPSLLTFVFLSSSPLVTHASPSLAPLPHAIQRIVVFTIATVFKHRHLVYIPIPPCRAQHSYPNPFRFSLSPSQARKERRAARR